MYGTDKINKSKERLTSEYRLALQRQLYQQSFYDFFKDAFKVLRPNDRFSENWHLQYLADYFQQEIERINRKEPKTLDSLINVPPRSSKTLLISVCLNAWSWGCVSPYLSFMCISHSEEVAIENAKNTKDLIESDWYKNLFPNVQIRQDLTARSNFQNTLGGSRLSYSIGASITGLGCDLLLLDDAHDAKNTSIIKLDVNIKAYRETLYNRINDPKIGLRVIIGQRVHTNDIFGFILSNSPERYHHICLPVSESDDIQPPHLRIKYVDGQLWPDRFPIADFANLSDSDFVFNTQYMQSPAIAGSGIIKEDWLEVVESAPSAVDYHLFIDTAFTSNKSNDPSAIMIAGIKDNQVYIKHCGQYWLEFPDLLRKVKELSTLYQVKKVHIEPKANGISLIQTLRKETMLNVIELPAPKDSKITRLNSITPKLESRRVKIVRGAWNENFLFEVGSFPNGKHDDQIDVLFYAVDMLLGGSGRISWYM